MSPTLAAAATLLALTALSPATARAGKLGDHPAIVVARLHAAQGYDYAAQFYPHPAKLYLLLRAPVDSAPADAAVAAADRTADAPAGTAVAARVERPAR